MESDEHAIGKPKKRGDSSGLTADLKADLSDINDLLRSAQSPEASEPDTIPSRPREKDGYSLLPARLPAEALKPIGDPAGSLTEEDLRLINTRRGLFLLLRNRNVDLEDVRKRLLYEHELEQLQVELVKLQRWVQRTGERIAILVEGRDAAGKGGTIRRFTEHLNPRAMRVVALPKPTDEERGQWYFQRYIRQLPNRGEIVFFDRSWYNRAV
ncbi:MAG: hypothetical protein NNA21_13145, partial [Nitrospira sp.]|nr:hypothetical protein [Nitrospira sp.]